MASPKSCLNMCPCFSTLCQLLQACSLITAAPPWTAAHFDCCAFLTVAWLSLLQSGRKFWRRTSITVRRAYCQAARCFSLYQVTTVSSLEHVCSSDCSSLWAQSFHCMPHCLTVCSSDCSNLWARLQRMPHCLTGCSSGCSSRQQRSLHCIHMHIP